MKALYVAAALLASISNMLIGLNLYAEPYPNRPVELVVTMDPGAAADTAGRLFAEELGKVLKTQVMVLNKPGAGSTLGADLVAKSKKNGYTLLYATASSVVYTKALNPEIVPFDPTKDLEPLGLHCFFPETVTVQKNAPWKTFEELIDHAKKHPSAVRVSIPGQGQISHLNVETIAQLTGAQFTIVPFKGGNAAMTALLGGHVDFAFIAGPAVGPQVSAGKLRMLLITNKMRSFPDVPIMTELGYKQDLLFPWFALYGPAGLPEEVKKVLISGIEKAVKNPEMEGKLEKIGFMVDYRSPPEQRKLQERDYATARSLVIKMGLAK
jgi:tripartite-type tricarboxylate transporter receptor subunit TctC